MLIDMLKTEIRQNKPYSDWFARNVSKAKFYEWVKGKNMLEDFYHPVLSWLTLLNDMTSIEWF